MHCPACGVAAQFEKDLEIFYWRENRLQFLSCSQCGLSFAHPFLTDAQISRGNQALSRLYQQGRGPEQQFRDARKAYLKGKMLAARLRRWKPEGRLLDLGCFDGFIGYGVAQNSQWEVEGLEIIPELAQFVQQNLGLPCYLGTLQSAAVESDRFDWIICHDLIEHINETEGFLRDLVRVLKPGGRIEIITPNATQDLAFARRASRAGTPMTMLLNHIMMFTPDALRAALERAGLKVRELYCYDVRHTPKDMGWFGLGQPRDIRPGPSLEETLRLPASAAPQIWTPEELARLRAHSKASSLYGFLQHTLPEATRLRVPARIGLGHEIYAVAEKISG